MNAPEDLLVRLRRAGSRELLTLVNEHLLQFSVREVRQTLLNPFVTPEVIDELLQARDLLSTAEVRAALARHRRTPPVAALRLLPGLFWRDLLEVSADLRIRPEVRRVAEKYLLLRLPRLTTGEKIALARRASPALHAELIRDPERRVVEALLANGRLTELTVLGRVSDPHAPPRHLALLARHRAWGSRYTVRSALARNPAAPFRVIFDLLPTLRRRDLREIAGQESHSSIVRARAEETLAAKGGTPGGDADCSETPEVYEIPSFESDVDPESEGHCRDETSDADDSG